ncbi:MAG: cobalt ECF transporter T component CbiQ [Candidatus Faecousia sp.]|nr:cobalt ECF transporter T component CbiQ [Candidatus Faecousia sp.]
MEKLTNAQRELREMDDLAAEDSPVHRLNPLCKLVVTVFYIATVVSYPKYDLSSLIVMVLYPVLLFQAAGIPVGLCFRKLRIVLPLVCAVGLVNPFLDHTPLIPLGNLTITGGMVSMVTLMLKGVFALMASFLLIATTSMDTLCAALRRLHVPDILTTLLLLTYRYIGVMLDEVSVMTQAYSLRAPGQKGIHISAWGSFLGQLLLRSMDRAEALYHSMLLRGFRGEYYYADVPPCGVSGFVYMVVCAAAFLCARWVNLPALLGSLFVR